MLITRETLLEKFKKEGLPEIAARMRVAQYTDKQINQLNKEAIDDEGVLSDTVFLDELMSRRSDEHDGERS